MAKDRFDHLFIAPSSFDRALSFYRDALGWSTVTSWGSEREPRGAILDGGDLEIVLAERHDASDHSWSDGINEHRPTVHVMVDDLDARFREIAPRVEIVVGPEATHWGTRWFVVSDPDRNLIAYEQRDPARATP
jgi:catechol 2,3-dioxygenase-like lactoylglutathione lyase family enzyme